MCLHVIISPCIYVYCVHSTSQILSKKLKLVTIDHVIVYIIIQALLIENMGSRNLCAAYQRFVPIRSSFL